MQIILGITFGILVSGLAWRAGSLSKSGAVSAAVVGSLIFGLGGIPWGVQLLGFFITSSLLSKAFRKQKLGLSEKFSKGHTRDWGQVFANGGLGTLLVIIFYFGSESQWVWFAYVGAMAAVNADTWATELGVLNPTAPRLIINGKLVEPGTSGGVSLYGLLASLTGSTLIALLGVIFTTPGEKWLLALAATLGGFCGSIFDSYLGATVQAIYQCPSCKKETERYPQHTCGSETYQIRGWNWLNNDLVNLSASIIGAMIAIGIRFLFS